MSDDAIVPVVPAADPAKARLTCDQFDEIQRACRRLNCAPYRVGVDSHNVSMLDLRRAVTAAVDAKTRLNSTTRMAEIIYEALTQEDPYGR